MSKFDKEDLLFLTAEIVSAHVSNNTVTEKNVPCLIKGVYDALENAGSCVCDDVTCSASSAVPAVPIAESVQDDFIVCLEDGKQLKMLKRHLKTAYNMTPDEYRARWNLPADYPMVAPSYAKRRSTLAKKIGLGKQNTGKRKQK